MRLEEETLILTKPGHNFLWFQRAKAAEFIELLLKTYLINVHQFDAFRLRKMHKPTLAVPIHFCRRQEVFFAILWYIEM